jgi:hypothetical protein
MLNRFAMLGLLGAVIVAPARYADTIIAGAVQGQGLLYGPENFRSLILEPVMEAPDLTQLLTISDDIKAKMDILFAKRFKKVTHLDTGCGTVPHTPGMDVEKLTWDPVALEAWIAECGSDFDGTFMAWGLGVGYKRLDLQEAAIKIRSGLGQSDDTTLNYWNEFVQDQMEAAIRDDIFRIGYFADPTLTAGQLTNGVADLKNYNQMRGLWPQIIALATAYPKVRAYTIKANQTATQELAPGESLAIFQKLIRGADRRLLSGKFGVPTIQCTQSIADNWADYRMSNDKLETSWQLQLTGLVGPKFLNVVVVPVAEWDDILMEDFDIAGKINLPHRAVLTTNANMQLGFDSYDKATQVDSWHNRETKFTHMRGNWKMDAKVMRPFLTRAAF